MASRRTNLMLTGSAIATICILWRLLSLSHYGLDFTDESYYIVSISNPYLYAATTTQFGFVYHPLFLLTGGDIPALRQANVLLTFGLAWALMSIFLAQMSPAAEIGRVGQMVIAAAFATASLTLFDKGMTTPNYNSLALQALLAAAIGMLLVRPAAPASSLAGWLLIGAGGWLAFMAKPTTAAGLAAVVCACLPGWRKMTFRLVLLSACAAALLLMFSALALDGSISLFAARLRNGMELGHLLAGGHTFGQLLRLDDFNVGARSRIGIAAISALTVAAVFLAISRKTLANLLAQLTVALGLGLTVLLCVSQPLVNFRLGAFQGMLIWAVVCAAMAIGLIVVRSAVFRQVSAAHWRLMSAFLVLPHVFAFGSNQNYWVQGSSAGIFWVMSGLVIAAAAAGRQNGHAVFLPLAAATQLVTIVLLQAGFVQPYRQPQPLQLNNQITAFGGGKSALVLSAGYASYISDASEAARKAGLAAGTPVIDMSGQSPGILYAMQAQSLGQAWMIGGYRGSLELAAASLEPVPCEKLADAWLLTEPAGKRRIPASLLASFGAGLYSDYELAGAWVTAAGVGGYPEQRAQELMRPTRTRDRAIEACNASKVTRSG